MKRRSLFLQAAGLAAMNQRSAIGQVGQDGPPPTDHFWWQTAPVSVVDWPMLVGPHRQLFIDDYVIAEAKDVQKQFHQPKKHPGYVLSSEHPWEGTACLAHGTVVKEESGRLRMYYIGSTWHVPFERASENPHNNVCVAYSNDGIRWEKPDLGMHTFFGRGGTNLVLPVNPKIRTYEQFSIIYRPDEPDPGKRWRMGCYLPGRNKFLDDPKDPRRLVIGKKPYEENGYYVMFSADGLKWNLHPEPIFTSGWTLERATWPMEGIAENSSIMFDTVRRKYVAFVRIWDVRPGRGRTVRARGITESEDFMHWSPPRTLFLPLELDEPGMQFYSSNGFNYESMYLGLLRCFRAGTTGQIYFQLVSSRDCVHWDRAGFRQPFIDNGVFGSYDAGYHSDFSNPPIRMGDELWFYYGSSTTGKFQTPRVGGICLAKLRLDGFASIEAGEGGGTLLTRPLDHAAGRLFVNAIARKGGSVRVDILDRYRRPIPGFTAEDAVPVVGDSIKTQVHWRGSSDLRSLANRTIRLKFHLQNAGLYSFAINDARSGS